VYTIIWQHWYKLRLRDDFVNCADAEEEKNNNTTPTTSTTGLEASVRVWLLVSHHAFTTTILSPQQFLLFEFNLIMPAWHHLCFWLDPAGCVTAYLDGQQLLNPIPLPLEYAFNETSISRAEVTQIWTNMETFRLVVFLHAGEWLCNQK
jgi:hypothetical protein